MSSNLQLDTYLKLQPVRSSSPSIRSSHYMLEPGPDGRIGLGVAHVRPAANEPICKLASVSSKANSLSALLCSPGLFRTSILEQQHAVFDWHTSVIHAVDEQQPCALHVHSSTLHQAECLLALLQQLFPCFVSILFPIVNSVLVTRSRITNTFIKYASFKLNGYSWWSTSANHSLPM